MPHSKFSISAGPQFRGGKTAYLFFVMMAIFVFAVALLINEEWAVGASMLFVALLLIFFTFDIQGVEVDLSLNRIRRYRWRPWGREGEWKPLNNFKVVQLGRENYLVKVAQIYSNLIGAGPRVGKERHSQFIVCISSIQGEHIILKETEDIRAALKTARSVASRLNIPLKDHVKEALIAQHRF